MGGGNLTDINLSSARRNYLAFFDQNEVPLFDIFTSGADS